MGNNQDTHVYCTDCDFFKCDGKDITCCYEDKCNIWDAEDSKPLSERPYYKKCSVELEIDNIRRHQSDFSDI